jgi:phosphatidylserine decarboxylase
MFITRLYICDYHHVHFPDSGICDGATAISGGLWAVSPYGRRSHPPFYAENYRMRSAFRSDHFGLVTIVEIGAFTVGSIQQRYSVGSHVERADRKSVFAIGGSTVVMLFEPGRIGFDQDLVTNTARGLETYVRLGDSIGSRPD